MLKHLKNYTPDEFESQKHPFSIKRLSTTIGAELLDIDLKKDLSKEERNQIYDALLTYKVIFFCNQNLTTEEHLKFGQYFGELEIHPFAPLGTNREDHPEVLRITHNEDNKDIFGNEHTTEPREVPFTQLFGPPEVSLDATTSFTILREKQPRES